MFKVALGQSVDPLVQEAVHEVLEKINKSLGPISPTAGLLFCPEDYDHKLALTLIRKAYRDIELIGCTTDGTISSESGFEADALVLMVFATDIGEIKAGRGMDCQLNNKAVGIAAAKTASDQLKKYKGNEKFAIMIMDPLNAGVSKVTDGLEAVLGDNFPFIGAASSAHSKKRQTYQFYNDEVLTNSLVLLLFAGDIDYSFGIQGGHSPLGEKARVTSSKDNILYTIENEPALAYFQKYIGTDHSLFMNYCLAVYETGQEGYYVRSAPSSDSATGSVTLNGVIAEHSLIQIGTADKENCLASCTASIEKALRTYPARQKPAAALFFSCAGRKLMLGTKVVQEATTAKAYFEDLPYIGFYAYGEFAPMEQGTQSRFHGTTFISLLIGPTTTQPQ